MNTPTKILIMTLAWQSLAAANATNLTARVESFSVSTPITQPTVDVDADDIRHARTASYDITYTVACSNFVSVVEGSQNVEYIKMSDGKNLLDEDSARDPPYAFDKVFRYGDHVSFTLSVYPDTATQWAPPETRGSLKILTGTAPETARADFSLDTVTTNQIGPYSVTFTKPVENYANIHSIMSFERRVHTIIVDGDHDKLQDVTIETDGKRWADNGGSGLHKKYATPREPVTHFTVTLRYETGTEEQTVVFGNGKIARDDTGLFVEQH